MFDIGFWEMVVVGVVALLVVGPEQLPGMARKAGLWMGKGRRMLAEVKADVDRELHLEEIRQSIRQGEETDLNPIKDLADRVKSMQQEVEEEIEDFGPPPGWKPGMPTTPDPEPILPDSSAKPSLSKTEASPVSLQKSVTDSPAAVPQSLQPPSSN